MMTMYSFLMFVFPEVEIRNLIWEFSDPATDRVMWPEYRPRFEDWGWYGFNEMSCVVCGLLTEYWDNPVDRVTYLIPSHCELVGHWHFTPVCSVRCERWDDLTNHPDLELVEELE